MKYTKLSGAASAALMLVIILTLVLAPGAWAQSKYKTLYKFKGGKDGRTPMSGLVFDTAGSLYGTTLGGGVNGEGTVFKLTPNPDGSWDQSVLYSFKGGEDGTYPAAGLIFDAAGNLYSTTGQGGGNSSVCNGGCGTVFKLAANADGSWTESLLHSFTGQDGAIPFAGLIFDASGNIYGAAQYGGVKGRCLSPTPGCGVVFKLRPNTDGSWTESVLHHFTAGKDGAVPYGGLIFDQVGNLFGTTVQGGSLRGCDAVGCGVIFKLTSNADGSWTENVLHRFTGGKDGWATDADLLLDGAGSLYGTARSGGAGGYGAVFRLTPNSNVGWHETVLHAFVDRPGAYPFAGLIFDAARNLYGTTYGDGSTTFGSVFEITP